MLAVDLGVFNRKSHVVSLKEARSGVPFGSLLAMIFLAMFYSYTSWKFGPDIAKNSSLEFLAGYVLEYTLSIDNIFVFVLVFQVFFYPA